MVNRKLVSFRLPDDLMQELRERADSDNVSVTELVCRLLRQGLQSGGNERVPTLVDERIANLEAEIHELRQVRPVGINPVPPTPVYALLTQSAIAHESAIETRERLTRLEQMMEKFMSTQSGCEISHPSPDQAFDSKGVERLKRDD
jgi:plasmid stability protein